MKRLRLVKLVIQPIFVIDDGTSLIEAPAEPIQVSGADWSTFPAQFAASIAEQESVLNETPPAE